MDCSSCKSPMIPGEISFEATLGDLVTGGQQISPIVFRAEDGAAVPVIYPSDSNPAYRCESCGHFMIVTDPEYTDTQCVVCKTAMPAGTTSCPKCGWTYKGE